MRELIVHDDRELRRIEAAIASIRKNSATARSSRCYLLAALEAEREEVLRSLGRGRPRQRMAA